MAHLIDDPLPDHIIVEQIDNLNRKLIDTKERLFNQGKVTLVLNKYNEYEVNQISICGSYDDGILCSRGCSDRQQSCD